VLAAFHNEMIFSIELERSLDFELTARRYKGEGYEDVPEVRAALERVDREFKVVKPHTAQKFAEYMRDYRDRKVPGRTCIASFTSI
jgi:hypothetical protein